MTIPHDLLNDLRSSPADLARMVEAMVREGRPNIMILRYAVTSLGSAARQRRQYASASWNRRAKVRIAAFADRM
jgi:hypothetical protein